MTEKEIIKWLLDGDPAIRWQVMCDLLGEGEAAVVQEERGHTVATGGPYHFVRHPGYCGAILAALSTPLLLGSFWALIPSIGSAAMYIVRTSLEDKTLIEELPGYSDYTQQTRFRLLPGVW